jgi:hypothetical protein
LPILEIVNEMELIDGAGYFETSGLDESVQGVRGSFHEF